MALQQYMSCLINPHVTANTDAHINIGLSLVDTTLEVGVDSLARFPSLLELIQDSICRNLVSLLATERIGVSPPSRDAASSCSAALGQSSR